VTNISVEEIRRICMGKRCSIRNLTKGIGKQQRRDLVKISNERGWWLKGSRMRRVKIFRSWRLSLRDLILWLRNRSKRKR
jgi:hypothetical protein